MVVVLGALVVVLCLVAQGVYTLKTGKIAFFLVRPSSPPLPKPTFQRMVYGAFYACCGGAILGVLAEAALHHGASLQRLKGWARTHAGPLVTVCLAGASGVMLLARPTIGMNWARAAYPEIRPDSRLGLLIVRIVAGMLLAFAALILSSIVSS